MNFTFVFTEDIAGNRQILVRKSLADFSARAQYTNLLNDLKYLANSLIHEGNTGIATELLRGNLRRFLADHNLRSGLGECHKSKKQTKDDSAHLEHSDKSTKKIGVAGRSQTEQIGYTRLKEPSAEKDHSRSRFKLTKNQSKSFSFSIPW